MRRVWMVPRGDILTLTHLGICGPSSRGGAFTTVGVPARVAADQLVEAAEWASRQAWPTPLYRQALPWVAVGAVAAYFAVRLLREEGYAPPRDTGLQQPPR